MKIGITGHQSRPDISWPWVRDALTASISSLTGVERAFTSLAAGSDQVFAQVALSLNVPVTAVIPTLKYETYFKGQNLADYHDLFQRSKVIQLEGKLSDEESFFDAGKYVVHNVNVLYAVWDGEPSKGLGGTADVVGYAQQKSVRIIRLNPGKRTIEEYNGGAND